MSFRMRLALLALRVVSLLLLKRGYVITVISPETLAAYEERQFEAANLYDKAKAAGIVGGGGNHGQYL